MKRKKKVNITRIFRTEKQSDLLRQRKNAGRTESKARYHVAVCESCGEDLVVQIVILRRGFLNCKTCGANTVYDGGTLDEFGK